MQGPFRVFRRLARAVRAPRFPGEGELVSIDLETTSLDPRSARILSIAAVPIRDRRIVLSESFTRTVQGDGPVDREAVKYHRLRPADVADGVSAIQAARDFVDWLDGRPLLGYCTGFDIAALEGALHGHGAAELDVERFDLRDIYRMRKMSRDPNAVVPGNLEVILASVGVPVTSRHTALGDATAVAMAYLALRYGVP